MVAKVILESLFVEEAELPVLIESSPPVTYPTEVKVRGKAPITGTVVAVVLVNVL